MSELPRRFSIAYAPVTRQHLQAIETKYCSLIRDTVLNQLSYEPDSEKRNRKPLKRPAVFTATWELRFGPQNRFRVHYDVDREEMSVLILAIAVKRGNRVIIGGEEIEI